MTIKCNYVFQDLSRRTPNTIGYIHGSNFGSAFKGGSSAQRVRAAENHIVETIESLGNRVDRFDFLLAMAWADDGNRMIDFFGHSDVLPWPGENADVKIWTTRNGNVYSSRHPLEKPDDVCEHGLQLVVAEGLYRQSTSDLDEYLRTRPFRNPGVSDGFIRLRQPIAFRQ